MIPTPPRPRASREQVAYILTLARRAEWITNDDWERLRAYLWQTHQAVDIDSLTPVQAGATIRELKKLLGYKE